MHLLSAYDKLGLKPPWKFEKDAVADSLIRSSVLPSKGRQPVRRTGSSTHMLLELYLDLHDAILEAGLEKRHRIIFIVITQNQDQIPTLRGTLRSIHSRLSLDVDISKVEFVPRGTNPDRFRGWNIPSWGIFCDHSFKECEGITRLESPWSFTRKVVRLEDDVFQGLDRSHRALGLTTLQGVKTILKASQLPITANFAKVNFMHKVGDVTYPAWSQDPILPAVQLKRAYQL